MYLLRSHPYSLIVVPYFPNFFPLEYWLTDLCSAAHFCICLADMTAGPKPSMKMTLSKPVSPMGSWSSQKLLLHTYIILYIHYIYIYRSTQLHRSIKTYTDPLWPPRNEVKSQDTGQLPWNCWGVEWVTITSTLSNISELALHVLHTSPYFAILDHTSPYFTHFSCCFCYNHLTSKGKVQTICGWPVTFSSACARTLNISL